MLRRGLRRLGEAGVVDSHVLPDLADLDEHFRLAGVLVDGEGDLHAVHVSEILEHRCRAAGLVRAVHPDQEPGLDVEVELFEGALGRLRFHHVGLALSDLAPAGHGQSLVAIPSVQRTLQVGAALEQGQLRGAHFTKTLLGIGGPSGFAVGALNHFTEAAEIADVDLAIGRFGVLLEGAAEAEGQDIDRACHDPAGDFLDGGAACGGGVLFEHLVDGRQRRFLRRSLERSRNREREHDEMTHKVSSTDEHAALRCGRARTGGRRGELAAERRRSGDERRLAAALSGILRRYETDSALDGLLDRTRVCDRASQPDGQSGAQEQDLV